LKIAGGQRRKKVTREYQEISSDRDKRLPGLDFFFKAL